MFALEVFIGDGDSFAIYCLVPVVEVFREEEVDLVVQVWLKGL
jgi:hypothetical protein